jgi:hypothetical protein
VNFAALSQALLHANDALPALLEGDALEPFLAATQERDALFARWQAAIPDPQREDDLAWIRRVKASCEALEERMVTERDATARDLAGVRKLRRAGRELQTPPERARFVHRRA